MIDILFVHPGDSNLIYQNLSNKFSAIENPTWSLLLAQSCRSKGYQVNILDCDAERLDYTNSAKRIIEQSPKLVCFVVYGQNPNAGTTKMSSVYPVAKLIKESYPEIKTMAIGSHASALPKQVLLHPAIDYVSINEGVYTLHELLGQDFSDLSKVSGLGYKESNNIILNSGKVVPTNRMDIDLPGYAWDLLPKKIKPFDMYRSCNWHAHFNEEKRTPYASIYTSLGCQFKCDFCMINIVNRTSNEEGVNAANSSKMRFWSPEFVVNQIEKLIDQGVETLRIVDELFVFNKNYYQPICQMLKDRGLGKLLNMWYYCRVDCTREEHLKLLKDAGFTFAAFGIENFDTKIRREVTKGTYEEVDIAKIVKQTRDNGINVIANYIFGLPDDDYETMSKTIEGAIELNTEMANFYCAMAIPGSPLYAEALKNNWALPSNFSEWSFHSYDSLPLPTKNLSASEVLRFRDRAWEMYFNRPEYLNMISNKFGQHAADHIREMTSIKLKRKLLGD